MTKYTPEIIAAFDKWLVSDSALDLLDCPFEYLREAFASAFTSRQQEVDRLKQQRDELLTENLKMKQMLLNTLYYHQGSNSKTGQMIRKYLGIGKYDRLTEEHLAIAKAGEA